MNTPQEKFKDFVEQRRAKNVDWRWRELYHVVKLGVICERRAKRDAFRVLKAATRSDICRRAL